MTRSIREKATGPKHSDAKGHILDPSKTTKRSGAGKGNWGSPLDDIDDIDTAYLPHHYAGGGNKYGQATHSLSSSVSSNASSTTTSPIVGTTLGASAGGGPKDGKAGSAAGEGSGFNLMKARRRSNSQSLHNMDRARMIARFEAEEPVVDEI